MTDRHGAWWTIGPLLRGGACPDDAGLDALRADGVQVIVCLLGPDERPRYDPARAEALGFAWHAIPIADMDAPTFEQCDRFVRLVADRWREGLEVFVHCAAGLGRTGTMAAVHHVAQGMAAADAIAHVRAARPGAIETRAQEAAVRAYADQARARG